MAKSKSFRQLAKLLISLLLILLFSCSNLIDSFDSSQADTSASQKNSASDQYVTYTGKVVLNGAYPLQLIEGVKNSESSGSSRSALPKIEGLTIFATATSSKGEVEGDFSSSDANVFSIALAAGYEWTITAGYRKTVTKDGVTTNVTVFSASDTFTASLENPVMNKSLILMPESGGSGSLHLSMNMPTSITSVTAECISAIPEANKAVWANKVTSSTTMLTASDLPAGTYEVAIKFYKTQDSLQQLVYSTVQSINVIKEMQTNSWCSDGTELFTTSGISSVLRFNLTDDLIKNYLSSTLYVGKPAALADRTDIEASDSNSGSAYSPLASLGAAVLRIKNSGNSTKDYKIFISGTISGDTELSVSSEKAHSITIEKALGEENACLQGSGSGSVLTITGLVPVTISGVKITGGRSNKGGGIALMADTTLTLDGGTLVTGNSVLAGGSGGGISVGGGSTASKGGKLILKDCKIYANTVENGWGGGIFCEDASYNCEIEIKGNSVEIYNNKVTNDQDWNGQGGGIAIGNLGTVTMSAGKIYGNEGFKGGGVKLMDEKAAFIMTGGQIYGNTAYQGGGVHNSCNTSAASGKTYGFTMSGGKIYENTVSASTPAGGALFNGGIFQIKGSAYLPYGVTSGGTLQTGTGKNDLVLASGKNITITGALNPPADANGNVAVISLDEYVSGRQVLTLAASPSPSTTLASEYSKFSLADESTVEIKKTGKTGTAGLATQFYVSAYGSDDNEGIEADAPFATLAQALKVITAQSTPANYTIHITGTLSGAQVIPASDTSDAENPITLNADTVSSLTLKGTDTSATLNGGFSESNKGTTLTISTTQPVTIKDLTITGGYAASNGGGLSIGENADVYITEGVNIIENYAVNSGGGIYNNQGNLTMSGGTVNQNAAGTYGGGIYSYYAKTLIYGSTMIGEDDSAYSEENKIATSTSYGNKANSFGGGIYAMNGILALGYSSYTSESVNTPAEFTGIIGRNFAGSGAGGISCGSSGGTVIISSGTISYNATEGYGGGITVSDRRALKMTGGSIDHNKAGYGAGLYISENGTVTINGGSISYNTATNSSKGGGGIFLGKYSSSYTATLNLYGATISNNTAESGKGGAIYATMGGNSFNIKGSAYISYGVDGVTGAGKNDLYLEDGMSVTIAGQLTPPSECTDGIVAALNPVPYSAGRQVLSLANGVTDTSIASEYTKFALIDQTELSINSTGYLALEGEMVTEFYVSASGSDSNNGSSSSTAMATITRALKRITVQGMAEQNYTIKVIGTLTGAQVIPASDASTGVAINAQTAKSITLCGTGLGAELNGGFTSSSKGTTLTISTAQPVTIKDLTIKGGFANHGSGVYVDTNANVLITTGTQIINNQNTGSDFSYGGGIYSKGTLTINGGIINHNVCYNGGGVYIAGGKAFIYGNIMIGEDDATFTEADKIPTASSCGNRVKQAGGGIYVDKGLLAIGYSAYTSETDNTPAEFTGKICRNYAELADGGISISSTGTSVIDSGTISYNATPSDRYGGGIGVSGSGGSLTMTGGNIEHNTTGYGAGIWLYANAKATIRGGVISYNTATHSSKGGGGIYLEKSSSYSATLNLYGGTISNNSATASGLGGAIYVDNGTSFNIKGSAYIPYGVDGVTGAGKNDLYLTEGEPINIAGQLTPPSECTDGIVAAITPQTYTAGTSLLSLDSSPDPTTTLDAEAGKFAVVPSDSTGEWGISEEGKLASGIPASSAASAISSLTTSGSVTIYGSVSTDQLQAIASAIKALPSDVNVYLDLSQTSLTEIPANAFIECARLTGIDFPSGLTSIGGYAFSNCSGITSIHLPDSVTFLGNSAFNGCTNITSYTLPNNDSVVYQNRIFAGWNITELVVTKGRFTGSAVIAEIPTLTTVTLPADLGTHPVIYGCPNITTINYLGTRSQWDANKSSWLGNFTVVQQAAITVHCSDD